MDLVQEADEHEEVIRLPRPDVVHGPRGGPSQPLHVDGGRVAGLPDDDDIDRLLVPERQVGLGPQPVKGR